MRMEEKIFARHRPDFSRLAAYGFVSTPEGSALARDFCGGDTAPKC